MCDFKLSRELNIMLINNIYVGLGDWKNRNVLHLSKIICNDINDNKKTSLEPKQLVTTLLIIRKLH